MVDFLTEEDAERLVEKNLTKATETVSVQDILDSGAIPRLKGYKIQPGKCSDSVSGGRFSFHDADKQLVEDENPPLVSSDGTPIRLMFRSSRISTHDIGRGVIPFKDQVLSGIHYRMLKLVEHVVGNSQFNIPRTRDNSIVIAAENLEAIKVENVLREYMAESTTNTSLYQAWTRGAKRFCGHPIPDGIKPFGKLDYIMDTPSTKRVKDSSRAPEFFFKHGIVTKDEYKYLRSVGIDAFVVAREYLRAIGVILADTKLEHGRNSKGQILIQDEVFTPDSSRFWLTDNYEEAMRTGGKPDSYSKQFARDFSEGEQGYTRDQQFQIAVRYIMSYQILTGEPFKVDGRKRDTAQIKDANRALDHLMN